jgi:hypothetical protein
MSFVLVGLGAVSVGMSTYQAISQNKKAKQAEADARDHELEIEQLEANRQALINPYENMSNEYANLGVATQAAEFQAQEADIALANTLDTLMATGAGAGGATALAQAALKSKMGISASIEQQEANNEKLRAQGAMEVQKLKAGGEQWKWAQQEEREMQKLDREQAMMDNDLQQQQMHQQNVYNAMGDIAGTLGSVAGGITSSEGYEFDPSNPFWKQG